MATMSEQRTNSEELIALVKASGEIPRHVAVIMDGNGRWAAERGLPRREGHRAGMNSVREVVKGCLATGTEYLTVYAFSTENWKRPAAEISALMKLLREYVTREKDELSEKGVRVRVLGELDRLSRSARGAVDDIESTTREGRTLNLQLAISYSSRRELVHAARALAERVQRGELRPDEIGEEDLERELFTSGIPDPDLLIRTSGEFRISNFLLWQAAYAEIYVTPVLWPDFDRAEFYSAILEFQKRDRRFGKVST